MTLKVKPEYLSKRGRREFVILTVEDFERMKAAIEDAEDLRDLRRATKRNAKSRYYTSAEVERRLRARPTGKKKARSTQARQNPDRRSMMASGT